MLSLEKGRFTPREKREASSTPENGEERHLKEKGHGDQKREQQKITPRLRENLGGGKGVVSRTEIRLLRKVYICLCVSE